VIPLLLAGGLYALGAWRLSRRAPGAMRRRRPAFALMGGAAVAAALVSPLDLAAERSFVAHMTQHMLLITIAAPALLLADPLPVVLWALPRTARATIGGWLRRGAALRRVGAALTGVALAWAAHTAVLWLWHVPAAYDAALASRVLHHAEHATFFVTALLFWWPVIQPAPRLRPPAPPAARVIYLVLAAFQAAALGLLLTLAPAVLYRTYAATHRDAPAALADQMWGGLLMWGVGGLVDMLAVLVLLARVLGAAGGAAPAPDRVRAL
jgi:putative membrane protein